MSNQGVFSVARGKNLGDVARGEDDDGDQPPQTEKKVQIDNTYFDKLKERLGQQGGGDGTEPATGGLQKSAKLVIYNDDGTVYKPPG